MRLLAPAATRPSVSAQSAQMAAVVRERIDRRRHVVLPMPRRFRRRG
jgi:hypothetical protein